MIFCSKINQFSVKICSAIALIIVMDNARFHIREHIKTLIEQAGHTILWLPAYSPDLNPIALHSGEAVLRYFLAQGVD